MVLIFRESPPPERLLTETPEEDGDSESCLTTLDLRKENDHESNVTFWDLWVLWPSRTLFERENSNSHNFGNKVSDIIANLGW